MLQKTSNGTLPLVPLSRFSDPTSSENFGFPESHPPMAQLATPEEDRPEEESAYTYISTNTIASSLQQNRKGQPPNLVFLPHESSCLDITLGRFNPYQPKLKEEAMISSSLHKAYGPEPGQLLRRCFHKAHVIGCREKRSKKPYTTPLSFLYLMSLF